MSNSTIDDILARLHLLQIELEAEVDSLLHQKQEQFRYSLEQGKVRFEKGIKSFQRNHKTGLWSYFTRAKLGHILTAPIIYSPIIAFVLLDVMVSLYQLLCFPVYGIPRVKRASHIIIDRQHLAYLNAFEKINCIYCGYANGLIEYVREVTARTEQFWCPIKHASRTPDPHRLTKHFIDYGDPEIYKKRLQKLRSEIKDIDKPAKPLSED